MYKFCKTIIFVAVTLNFLQSCGYKPLLSSKNQKFSVTNVVISGDKKLARTLGNYFSEIENVSNNLIFEIDANKQKVVSSRTNIGATSEFTVNLNFELKVFSEKNNEEILKQNFSRSQTFKTSKVHLDTLRRENKIVDNSIKDIAQEISKRLNVIFN
tara:strand:+ start:62 stop:532 length:471 start_codon:yes stop_codon:yes gene_type:complete